MRNIPPTPRTSWLEQPFCLPANRVVHFRIGVEILNCRNGARHSQGARRLPPELLHGWQLVSDTRQNQHEGVLTWNIARGNFGSALYIDMTADDWLAEPVSRLVDTIRRIILRCNRKK